MISLREYQLDCIDTVYKTFMTQDRQLIQLPTGAGKTFIFLNYLKQYSRKALIICPTRELQEQICKWAKYFKLGTICIKSCRGFKQANFYIITAQSLSYQKSCENLWKIDFDHIIIDEAHRAQADTYKQYLEGVSYPYKLLGCTATPERLDGKPLLEIFQSLSFDRNLYDLIVQGHLCDIEAYRIKTGLKISARRLDQDFMPVELKRLDVDSRNTIIFDTFRENLSDKKTLIFCLSVEHSIKIAKLLQNHGYKAEAIHGSMPMGVRQDILSRFTSGETMVLTNCQLLTEGFDEPTIEALLIARPTKSKSLYCQMIGRGVRKLPGKDVCYLYELSDNAHNICSFNVAAGLDPELDYEYGQGVTLTKLKKELDTINIKDIETKKERMQLLPEDLVNIDIRPLSGNSINLLKSEFYKMPATNGQIKYLESNNMLFDWDINFLEATFLIWKHKLGEKYGIDTRKRWKI